MAVLSNSVAAVRAFKMIDAADHITKKTGLTPTVNISKNGAAFSGAAGVVAEIGNGWYSVSLTTNDTDTNGDLAFYITAGGADDTDFVDQVTTNNLNDTLPVNLTQVRGSNVNTAVAQLGVNVIQYASGTAGSTKYGLPNVNVTHWSSGTNLTPNKLGVPIVDVQYYSGATTNSLIAGRVDSNAQVVGDKTGYSLSDPQSFSITGNITGNLTGSVGSVTAPVNISQGVNVTQWASGTALTPIIKGSPKVDIAYFSGGTAITPNKIGIPIVDVSYWGGATTNSLIAGRVDSNAQVVGDKTGYTVSTVQDKSGYTLLNGVNVTQWVGGTIPSTNVTGVPKVDVIFTGGTTPLLRIKKNAIYNGFTFPMIDSADHITLKSGLTVSGTVSIDGGSFGALTNSPSEIGTTGIYTVNLAAADLNGSDIMLKFTSAGADTRLIKITTQT
jgi:hypothetical protein